MGRWIDDYGGQYIITDSLWTHGRNRYHVLQWVSDSLFLVARNDSANAGERGLYTRIDWMPLTDMAPWRWAYCLSAYRAPSPDSARRTTTADRTSPRVGCHRFPFSRLRRDST
jgi:hypothetical protein